MLAGDGVLREFSAADDFTEHISVPADALVAAATGRLSIETSQLLRPARALRQRRQDGGWACASMTRASTSLR